MLRVTTRIGGAAGTPAWNQLYFGGSTSGEAAAAADAVEAFWQALANFIVNDYTFLVLSEVEQVDPATGQIVATYPATTAVIGGGDAGDPLPWTSQGLIRLRTGTFVNGRELRGRIFVPGWPETASTGGQPTAPMVAASQAAMGALTSSASPEAGDLVVYSPTHRVAAAVTSYSTWDQWAVLRSRRP